MFMSALLESSYPDHPETEQPAASGAAALESAEAVTPVPLDLDGSTTLYALA